MTQQSNGYFEVELESSSRLWVFDGCSSRDVHVEDSYGIWNSKCWDNFMGESSILGGIPPKWITGNSLPGSIGREIHYHLSQRMIYYSLNLLLILSLACFFLPNFFHAYLKKGQSFSLARIITFTGYSFNILLYYLFVL